MFCNVITLSIDKIEPIYLGDIFYYITVDNRCSYIDSTKDDLEGIDSGYCFKTEQDCNEYLKTKGKIEKCEIQNKDFTKNLEMAEVEGDGWSFEVWVDPTNGVHYNVPIEIVRDWSNMEER